MNMNTLCVFILGACLASAAAAQQQNDREAAHRQRMMATPRGNWMAKRVMSKEFMEKVGIGGDQAQKIKAELEAIDKQSATYDQEIGAAAAEQAKIAKKVLSEPGANVDEMMKIIEKIGAWRTEQAKLATKRLVTIRDNLTPEQREKAAAILMEDQKKWREERDQRDKNAAPARPAAPKGW